MGLSTASGSGVSGIGETVRTALGRLQQALPRRLWRRIEAMRVSTVVVPDRFRVDAEQLSTVVSACGDHQELRFDYFDARGGEGYRRTQPHELVTCGDRWYLVAWGRGRTDWRTFRIDRLPTGPYFTPREVPGGDRVESVNENSCLFSFGACSLDSLAFLMGAIDVDFDIIEPPEPADRLRRAVARFRRAVVEQ